MHVAHSLATFTGGLFAGATLYVSVVAQPIRMALGAAIALPTYRASLQRSERLNPLLHVGCLLFTLAACMETPLNRTCVIALVLMAPILPLSLIVIRPLNQALRSPNLTEPDDLAQAMGLLTRWGRLHAVRTVLAMAAFLALVA